MRRRRRPRLRGDQEAAGRRRGQAETQQSRAGILENKNSEFFFFSFYFDHFLFSLRYILRLDETNRRLK